jgi:hypothetical protein
MIKLYVSIDSEKTGYYITYEEDFPIEDESVAKKLNISLEDYQSILKKYGAYGIEEYEECYFRKKKDAEYCVKCLEQEINTLKNSRKCICEQENNEDIRIVKIDKTGNYELQFWEWVDNPYDHRSCNSFYEKIKSLEIEFCPKCGRKL